MLGHPAPVDALLHEVIAAVRPEGNIADLGPGAQILPPRVQVRRGGEAGGAGGPGQDRRENRRVEGGILVVVVVVVAAAWRTAAGIPGIRVGPRERGGGAAIRPGG